MVARPKCAAELHPHQGWFSLVSEKSGPMGEESAFFWEVGFLKRSRRESGYTGGGATNLPTVTSF